MPPITLEPAGNQQNQQHSYENFPVSDDCESLDMENIRPSSYEILQLNKTSLKYYNTGNNKWTQDHGIKGILID